VSEIEGAHNASDVRKLARLTYLQQFAANVIPIFPAYAIMFNDRSGLSTSQISLLFIICNVAAMLSEVPTGILADRISRRTVLLLSALLSGSSFALWLAWPNFFGYALGFVVWGIAFAMSSGALQAYLYDELDALGRSDAFTKIFSRGRALSYSGMFLGYGVAIAIGIEHYVWLLALSVVTCLLTASVTLLFPKDRATTSIARERGHLRSAMRTVRMSPMLQRIVPTIAVIGASIAIVEDYVPLYYSATGISLRVVPYLLLAGIFLGIIVTWFAHRFEHRQPLRLMFMVLSAGLVLLTSSLGGKETAVVGMMGFMALLRLAVVLFEASLQHEFEGASRATLGSLPTFLNEIWGVGLAAVYGVTAHLADDFAAIRALAVTVAVTAVGLTIWWRLLPSERSEHTQN
jgi:MFS family permease